MLRTIGGPRKKMPHLMENKEREELRVYFYYSAVDSRIIDEKHRYDWKPKDANRTGCATGRTADLDSRFLISSLSSQDLSKNQLQKLSFH